MGPRTLCNACGLKWARVVRLSEGRATKVQAEV